MSKRVEKIKNLLKVSFTLAFISFLAFVFHKTKQKDNFLLKNGVETDATIYRVGLKIIGYTFEVDGITFKGNHNNPYPIIYNGEVFKLRYNAENPNQTLLMLTSPTFPRGVQIDSCYTEQIEIPLPFGLPEIKYYYIVNGKKYERWQRVSSRDIDLHRRYTVQYRVDRPEIGYIFFGKQ